MQIQYTSFIQCTQMHQIRNSLITANMKVKLRRFILACFLSLTWRSILHVGPTKERKEELDGSHFYNLHILYSPTHHSFS